MQTAINEQILWQRYKIFYISQSTAFITPILYIFLQDQLNLSALEILQISSYYWMLSIFIQVPGGIITDRKGVKSSLYFSLWLQILSCLVLLFIHHSLAYHLYLICISSAQALCTSASTILIRQQFRTTDDAKFKEYTFNLQNSFYKLTSILIVLSSVLYTINAVIPFLLQIINFAISYYYLTLIPEQNLSVQKNQKTIFSCAKEDIWKSLIFITKEKYYLFLVICFTLFGLGISINHKAIQSQLTSLFDHDKIILTGCIIAVGNLFSSIGAKVFYQQISKRFSGATEILVVGSLLLLSFLLMGIDQLPYVIAGFMILNVFKGCYRPLVGTELINCYPFRSSMGTNSAVVYTLSVIFSSAIQYMLAFYYTTIEQGNVIFAIFSTGIIILSFMITKLPSKWRIKGKKNALTGKIGIIEKASHQITYIQLYPPTISEEHLKQISLATQLGRYPAKTMYPFMNAQDGRGIKSDFLGEIHLSDILDKEKQYRICQKVLMDSKESSSSLSQARISPPYHIFRPPLLELLKKDTFLNKICVIHGDLHPENIMVIDETPYVIDWDQCGNGPLWYDLLSLLSHPYLYFDKAKRYQLFLKHCVSFQASHLDLLFLSFCQFKEKQLIQFISYDQKFEHLAKQYAKQSLLYS